MSREFANKLNLELRRQLHELEVLLDKVNDRWVYEDGMYRYYHHSYKVFHLQQYTLLMEQALQKLAPDKELNQEFNRIVQAGIGKEFTLDMNVDWATHADPVVLAFLHAKYFLEQAVKYGKAVSDEGYGLLPSGYAALLYLYNNR